MGLLLLLRRRRHHLLLEEGRRRGRGGQRGAGRTVGRRERQHGEALAILLVEADQTLQLLLDVVHLNVRDNYNVESKINLPLHLPVVQS